MLKEEGLFGISDKEVLALAFKENRAVITHDKDFANLLKYPSELNDSHHRMKIMELHQLQYFYHFGRNNGV